MSAAARTVLETALRRPLWPSVGLTVVFIAVWLATPVSPHVDTRAASVIVAPGESLEAAARRAGVPRGEAAAASHFLQTAAPDDEAWRGATLRAVVVIGARKEARLSVLRIDRAEGAPVVLSRDYDGGFRLSGGPDADRVVVTVAEERIDGSLFDSAERIGADPALMSQAMALFAARLDFARDIRPGDRLRLVFTRRTDAAGETLETGALIYAEVIARTAGARLYGFSHDGRTEFLDAAGRTGRAALLRTPVPQARISSAFGMRNHPILGYSRMHQGVDFAAPSGTPVLAAGDGVVMEARPWAGYGNWLRIGHAGGWQTGYAHLAAYRAGIGPGAQVRQGDVIGYVGQTGLATGPHLHYEVWRDGLRVDPARAVSAQAPSLDPAEAADFDRQKARIDELLALSGVEPPGTPERSALTAVSKVSPRQLRRARL
jgi:murein DD-endopeptidase MepM/ murein hydrolase activator NlpD